MSVRLTLEIVLIVALMIANGLFAMSEIALVSSRKARLQRMNQRGDRRAAAALQLRQNPDRFLSTVQIGITLIGVLAGAFGGATLAGELSDWLSQYPSFERWSGEAGVALVVLFITYLSLVIGELVPKRIGLNHPERIAARVAQPMNALSRLATPAVKVLGWSTNAVLWLLRVRPSPEPNVTEEELRLMLREGTRVGTIEPQEQQIVERVFRLGDRRARSIMTPRHELVALDIQEPIAKLRADAEQKGYSRYLLVDGDLDHVVGILPSRELWHTQVSSSEDLRARARQPLFVPRNAPVFDVLEMIRTSRNHVAVVLDEYGSVEGMLTPADVLEALVGELPEPHDVGEPEVVVRHDGSISVDAAVDVEEIRLRLGLDQLAGQKGNQYQTVAGYVIDRLERVPKTGDRVEAMGHVFEILDMDGRRVDRILITKTEQNVEEP